MKNPYLVLGIKQDASNQEIIRAQAIAMRKKQFSLREIAEARAVLSKPATRLAADFTFPVFAPTIFEEIRTSVKSKGIDLKSINSNKYDSL